MPGRRILCLWFPRLASDRAGRGRVDEAPLAVAGRVAGAERLVCLNAAAAAAGLSRGMGLADARALCPGLATVPADPGRDAALLAALARWAGRFSPLVARDGPDGLMLDLTGVARLFGGEAALVAEAVGRLERLGFAVAAGLGDSRGGAWALARHGGGIAAPGAPLAALGDLPPAALRLDPDTAAALHRLGLRRIRDLVALPRAVLARRFGSAVVLRLDQALDAAPEPLSPDPDLPHFGVRLTLPEPIGLVADVVAGLDRLLDRLCARLDAAGQGARRLRLWLRRVDGGGVAVEIGLARPMREAGAIAALFAPQLDHVDAGFGIDLMRLTAPVTEALPPRQLAVGRGAEAGADRLADLLTRLGNRLGFEALTRMAPADSHIPERSFLTLSALWSDPPGDDWPPGPPRPAELFPPEPLTGIAGDLPPARFRWRGQRLATARAMGPERLSPEWWFDDPAWRSGPRDYWRVETAEGPRLWLFHTPADGGWAVQGEFP
ncbi:MAG: Y-family DNA polymerase [Gemmobacter sp.]